ncbi:MAG: hypothetical protein HY726_18710 [Candidatus Rokubacteria bacterium]|nr:hypothetical protein [Candidatus Rokubacteria bacterium]
MTGRSLHDALLRILTDGELRRRLVAGDPTVADVLGGDEAEHLSRADPERFRRLARFMARHFYRERIVRLFRYSRALSLATGRDPLVILESPAFGVLLDSAVLGSPTTADAVARLVEARLTTDLAERPYGAALVSYEGALFRVEAGPRRWHADGAARDGAPVRSRHARIIELDWNLTPLITALRSGVPSPPDPPREPTRLLLALSPAGRVTSVRCPEAVSRLLDQLDGRTPLAGIASAAGLGEAEARTVLENLTEIGAVEWRPLR